VWNEDIQQFMEEERRRTVEYFGHARYYQRLHLGLEYLRNERMAHRRETFTKLVVLWEDLAGRGFWEELAASLEAPEAASQFQAPDTVTTSTGKATSPAADAPAGDVPEKSASEDTELPETESPVTLDERQEPASSPIPTGDTEALSRTTDEEPKDTATEATASAPVEATPDPEAQPADDPALAEPGAAHRLPPDLPPIAPAPSRQDAVCECCGRNSFLQDELFRIDSGQLLCPECRRAFREKARRTQQAATLNRTKRTP
jgi:hypothetical protein